MTQNSELTNEELRALYESAPYAFVRVDREGMFFQVNEAFEKITGYGREELSGLTFQEILHPGDQPQCARWSAGLLEGLLPMVRCEIRIIHKLGHVVHAIIAAHPVRPHSGEVEGIVSVIRELSLPARAAELHGNLGILKATLESTADGILVSESSGRIIVFNRKFIEMWHLPETLQPAEFENRALELAAAQLKNPEPFLTKVVALYQSDETSFDEIEFKDGRIFERYSQPLQGDAGIKGRVWSFRNVTESRRLETQLQLADRMASVGRLAAGVAHEVNNPLAHVVTSLELALEKVASLDIPEGLRKNIRDAYGSSQRIARIVGDLKGISRPLEESLGPVELHEALENAVPLVLNQIRHRGRLVRDYGPTAPVLANEGRLNQVFLNLLVNAAQSLPEGAADRGEIRLRTWMKTPDQAVVEISDTGVGMSEEVRRHIFDPFYSTKPIGEGIGLGLSICYNIIKSLGGEIEVESEPGKGSSFRVILPRASALGAAETALRECAPLEAVPARKRRGRVLVIDDEPNIIEMFREVLEKSHEVVVTTDGAVALEMIVSSREDAAGEFDVIFCDLMMPRMTGIDLYERVHALVPGFERRIVFITGGAFSENAQQFVRGIPNRVIEKPFRLSMIRDLVSSIVAERTDRYGRDHQAGRRGHEHHLH